MKKTLLLISTIFLFSTVFCQKNLEDVIYLKNGSIIRGIIVEQVPNKSIKIQTANNSILNVEMNEIEKLTKEEPVKQQSESKSKFKQTGYSNFTEFGILTGIGMIISTSDLGTSYLNDVVDFSLSTSNGWLINPNVFAGIGIGVEKESTDYRLPLYFETRFFILSKTVTPVFYTDMGYAFGWEKGNTGSDWAGIFMSAGTGVLYHVTKSTSLSFSIAYKLQQIKLEWIRYTGYPYEQAIIDYEKSSANFIVFKIGFGF